MKTILYTLRATVITTIILLSVSDAFAQQPSIQYFRSYDKKGIGVFETSKQDSVKYDGFKLRIGAGFTQGYQKLKHSNKAKAILADGAATYIETAPGSGSFVNRVTGAAVPDIVRNPGVFGGYINTTNNKLYSNGNQLYELSGGFPLAQANLNIDVQLAEGVSLNLVSYMSSHHHNEFWVKGGYLKVDEVKFLNSTFFNDLWKNLTLKVGHMEVNYGDAHFRRSDGGNTFWNPWIENNIMDAFTTEIGAELYWQKNGVLLMGGFTDGEIQGNVSKPKDRDPSLYGKAGFDKMFGDARVRLTASYMKTKSSVSNTLFGGDRTGSNYQFVMDNTSATVTTAYTSGRFNPGYRDNLSSFVVNPFIKYKGLEFFGTFERAKGNAAVENGEVQYSNVNNSNLTVFQKLNDRKTTQTAAEVLYRFGKNENFYVGARYIKVSSTISLGQSATTTYISQGERFPVDISRTSFGGGWFISDRILLKGEYVRQNYNGFPDAFKNTSTSTAGYQDSSILAGGKFSGFVIQGSIAF
jgi:hypothetical protein